MPDTRRHRGRHPDDALERRSRTRAGLDELAGRAVAIDGFNLLIILESALSGSNIFVGRDGCYRDLASIHGTYRAVEETEKGIELTGGVLAELGVADVLWYLDAPVSNSGRLKTRLLETAGTREWRWDVELLDNPDRALADADRLVVSSDSQILDRCRGWINLAAAIIDDHIPSARIIDLR